MNDLSPEALRLESFLERWRQTVRVAERTGKRLAEKGGKLSLGIKGQADGPLEVSLAVPDQRTNLELAVALRDLLAPGSDLHHDNLFAVLRGLKSEALDAEVTQFEDAVKRAQQTNIKANGAFLNGQDVFVKLTRSIIFANDTDAAEVRAKLDHNPMMRDLLWFTFHNYNIAMSQLLLQFMTRLDQQNLFPRGPPRDHYCIYCKSTTAKFSTVDHTLPQSLGNTHSILPRGYACDDCQKVLSHVEQKALNSIPFNMMRVLNLNQTKDGKFTHAKLPDLRIQKTSPNSLRIERHGKSKPPSPGPDGKTKLDVGATGKFDHISVGQVLVKGALGGIALEKGRDHVLDPRFDAAREFLRTGKGLKTLLFIPQHWEPVSGVEMEFLDIAEGVVARINLFGMQAGFNLTPVEVKTLPRKLQETHLIFDLADSKARNPPASITFVEEDPIGGGPAPANE